MAKEKMEKTKKYNPCRGAHFKSFAYILDFWIESAFYESHIFYFRHQELHIIQLSTNLVFVFYLLNWNHNHVK